MPLGFPLGDNPEIKIDPVPDRSTSPFPPVDFLKVVAIKNNVIIFNDGTKLFSWHDTDCCESHYLDFSSVNIDDFEGLEFNLSWNFFERIKGYGIALLPVSGLPVRIPGYGQNDGYYGSDITLALTKCLEGGEVGHDLYGCYQCSWCKAGNKTKKFDVSECQDYFAE